jgi:hypothetical protein
LDEEDELHILIVKVQETLGGQPFPVTTFPMKFTSFQLGIMESLLESVDETSLVVHHDKLHLDLALAGELLLDAVGQPLVGLLLLGGQQGKGTGDDLVCASEAHDEDHLGEEGVLSGLERSINIPCLTDGEDFLSSIVDEDKDAGAFGMLLSGITASFRTRKGFPSDVVENGQGCSQGLLKPWPWECSLSAVSSSCGQPG